MPCLICGGATKGDSVICEKCLQKELQKKGGKGKQVTPEEKSDQKEDLSIDLDNIFIDQSLSIDSDEDLAIEPVSEEDASAIRKDETDDEIKLGDDIELDLDSIFTEKPEKKEPSKKDMSEDTDAIKENIRKKFQSLKLESTETNISKPTDKEDSESQIELEGLDDIFSTTFADSGENEKKEEKISDETMQLDLDQELDEREELELESLDLKLDAGNKDTADDASDILIEPEEEEEIPNMEEDPEQLKQVIPDTVESDEEILKKNIRDRLKQKISTNEPQDTKTDAVDDLLDEVILEEIEEIKQEEKLRETEAPKEKMPVETPVQKESQAKLKIPKGITEKSIDKKKPLIPEHPQTREKVIRGTTARRPHVKKEKKGSSSSKIVVILLLLILLGGGGYYAYVNFFKADPQKEQLLTLLADAQNKEQRGEMEAALQLYTNIVSRFSTYPEAAKAKAAIPRLKAEIEKMKKENEIREKISDLLLQANQLFEQNRWMSSRGKDAFGLYQEILRLDPDNAEAKNKMEEMKLGYLERGNKALTAGNYSRAKRYFLNVLAIDPNYTQASALISTCDALLSQKAKLEEEKKAEQKRLEEMQKQLQQRMLEEKRKQEEEARRIAEQKRLEEQKKLEQQRKLEEQKKKKEEDFSNKILLEAQVDGGRREYIRKVKPVYAGRLNQKTDVIVQVIVGNDGVPESVRILKTNNTELGRVVVDAVKKFRYKPPTYKGKPCKMSLIERFTFKPGY
jgi:TonB family protein